MAHTVATRFFLLLSGIWLGGVIAVGYLVAPTLFATILDRQFAGLVAGDVFRNTAITTLCTVTILLVLAQVFVSKGLDQYRIIRWYLMGILACTLIGACYLQPWMNELRHLANGIPVMQSPYAQTFGMLHGASSLLFMVEGLLGVSFFWKLTK